MCTRARVFILGLFGNNDPVANLPGNTLRVRKGGALSGMCSCVTQACLGELKNYSYTINYYSSKNVMMQFHFMIFYLFIILIIIFRWYSLVTPNPIFPIIATLKISGEAI